MCRRREARRLGNNLAAHSRGAGTDSTSPARVLCVCEAFGGPLHGHCQDGGFDECQGSRLSGEREDKAETERGEGEPAEYHASQKRHDEIRAIAPDETKLESTIPNSGNTARSPLHLGPSADDSVVTRTVSAAPKIMRPVRSLRLSGATLAMALLRGRNVCPNATAISAAAIAHAGDAALKRGQCCDEPASESGCQGKGPGSGSAGPCISEVECFGGQDGGQRQGSRMGSKNRSVIPRPAGTG